MPQRQGERQRFVRYGFSCAAPTGNRKGFHFFSLHPNHHGSACSKPPNNSRPMKGDLQSDRAPGRRRWDGSRHRPLLPKQRNRILPFGLEVVDSDPRCDVSGADAIRRQPGAEGSNSHRGSEATFQTGGRYFFAQRRGKWRTLLVFCVARSELTKVVKLKQGHARCKPLSTNLLDLVPYFHVQAL